MKLFHLFLQVHRHLKNFHYSHMYMSWSMDLDPKGSRVWEACINKEYILLFSWFRCKQSIERKRWQTLFERRRSITKYRRHGVINDRGWSKSFSITKFLARSTTNGLQWRTDLNIVRLYFFCFCHQTKGFRFSFSLNSFFNSLIDSSTNNLDVLVYIYLKNLKKRTFQILLQACDTDRLSVLHSVNQLVNGLASEEATKAGLSFDFRHKTENQL